ncbi:ABC transporter ATP-binding protein/permease [Dermabacteraceae bacterium TAE3-ERU27]|nr:ABC transporter ATP-binding protein/permease [Dermabacteraceae bacterium TAE3-ERU27]
MLKIYRAIREVMPYLPGGAQTFLRLYMVAASLLSLLDIAAFGLLSLSLGAMSTGSPVQLPLLGSYGQDSYPLLLALIAGLLIFKGIANTALYWLVTRKMAVYEQEMGDRLFKTYMSAPWEQRVGRNSAELVRLVDLGVGNTIGGIVLPGVSLVAEFATLLAIGAVIVITQPVTAGVTILYLLLVAAVMFLGIARPARVAGRVNRDASFRIVVTMTEMIAALKEITLRGKLGEVADVVQANRRQATRARANTNFLSRVPQYVVEMALVGGFLLVGGLGYLTGGPQEAFAGVALFGVAGFRLVPSLVRIQSVLTSAQGPLSYLEVVLVDFRQFSGTAAADAVQGGKKLPETLQELRFSGVSFTYPGAAQPALQDLDLRLPMGAKLGVAGASGAGKSTLIDLLLGLLQPSRGSISLDGTPLSDVLAAWRLRVGYVPQDVQLFDGTVAQNIALTWGEDYDVAKVRQCLAKVGMLELIEAREGGVHSRIGERGLSLSGGQRQRLGIARALYTDPLILVLDEATSALDSGTEEDINEAINELHGEVTVISVAHRLSTIRDSDLILFLKDGRAAAQGSFDDVVAENADFARQARLSGLA